MAADGELVHGFIVVNAPLRGYGCQCSFWKYTSVPIGGSSTGPHHRFDTKEEDQMGRSIIAAVDGSLEATNAVRVAARYADALERRLVLAFIASDPHVFPYGDPKKLEIARGRAIADGAAVLDATISELALTEARKRIALAGDQYGTVAERLAALVIEEDADLVVTGARAPGVLRELVTGSVTQKLIEISDCPVMVVPPDADVDAPLGSGVLFGVDGRIRSERAQLVA